MSLIACSFCTFLNKSDKKVCDVCENVLPIPPKEGKKEKPKIFDNQGSIAILATANEKSSGFFSARTKKIAKFNNEKKGTHYHMTIFQAYVNKSHKKYKMLFDEKGNIKSNLKEPVEKAFMKAARGIQLESEYGIYKKFNDYLVKEYKASNQELISEPRKAFYIAIVNLIGKSKCEDKVINDIKYKLYSYDGDVLLAVPEYYHGIGVWTPHVSIIHIKNMDESYIKLFDEDPKKLGSHFAKMGNINKFNMYDYFDTIYMSSY
jgi:hypothetical protein